MHSIWRLYYTPVCKIEQEDGRTTMKVPGQLGPEAQIIPSYQAISAPRTKACYDIHRDRFVVLRDVRCGPPPAGWVEVARSTVRADYGKGSGFDLQPNVTEE